MNSKSFVLLLVVLCAAAALAKIENEAALEEMALKEVTAAVNLDIAETGKVSNVGEDPLSLLEINTEEDPKGMSNPGQPEVQENPTFRRSRKEMNTPDEAAAWSTRRRYSYNDADFDHEHLLDDLDDTDPEADFKELMNDPDLEIFDSDEDRGIYFGPSVEDEVSRKRRLETAKRHSKVEARRLKRFSELAKMLSRQIKANETMTPAQLAALNQSDTSAGYSPLVASNNAAGEQAGQQGGAKSAGQIVASYGGNQQQQQQPQQQYNPQPYRQYNPQPYRRHHHYHHYRRH